MKAKAVFSSDRVRHRLYSSGISLLTLLCIASICLFTYTLEKNYSLVGDFSRSSVFSLSNNTKAYLSEIKDDVSIYLLHENNKTDETIAQILNAFSKMNPHIHIMRVDPIRDLDVMQGFPGIKAGAGDVIVANRDKSSHVVLNDSNFYLSSAASPIGIHAEQSLSSAIHSVLAKSPKRAVLASGHAEMDARNLGNYLTFLKNRAYAVLQFDITTLQFNLLNPSSDVLLFISPQEDLTVVESEALFSFIDSGGKAIFYMENSRSIEGGAGLELGKTDFNNFGKVFAKAGLVLNRDIILLPESRAVFGNVVAFWSILPPGQQPLGYASPSMYAVMAAASSVRLLPEFEDRVQIVGISPADSYRKELRSLEYFGKIESDPQGPFMTNAIARLGKGRIFLSGSASGLSNQNMLAYEGNYTIAMSVFSSMADDPENPVVHAKLFGSGKLRLSTVGQQILLSVIVMLIIPLMVLTFGIIVIKKRKSRKAVTDND